MRKLRELPPYQYVIIVVVFLAIVGLVAWQVRSNAQEARWERATEHFSKADYEKAAEELEGLDVPESPERLRVYAQTNLAVRDLDAALPAYQKLYEATNDASYKLIIGNIYNEQKRYDEAARVYQEVIASNPNNAQAYVNLATLHKLQNNTSEAVAVANSAVQNNPGNTTLHELRVSMLMENKRSPEYKEAVEALRRVSPDSALLKTLNE